MPFFSISLLSGHLQTSRWHNQPGPWRIAAHPPQVLGNNDRAFPALGNQKAQGSFGIKLKLEKLAEEGSQGSLGVSVPPMGRPVVFGSERLQTQCFSELRLG